MLDQTRLNDEVLASTEYQRDAWMAACLSDEANCAFNHAFSLKIKGKLNTNSLRSALTQLLRMNDALRIQMGHDGRQLSFRPESHYLPDSVDLSDMPGPAAEEKWRKLIARILHQPFEIQGGPLLHLHLFELRKDDHVLVFTYHAILADGISPSMLAEQLGQLYAAQLGRLEPAAGVDFIQYATWESSDEGKRKRLECLNYWTEKLSSAPFVELPLDKPRSPVRTYAAGYRELAIEGKLLEKMRRFEKQGVNPALMLVASFITLMHRLTGSRQITIGVSAETIALALEESAFCGRGTSCGGSALVPLKVELADDMSFTQFLLELRTTAREAWDHRYVTLGSLAGRLETQRDLSRPPLISTMLNVFRQDCADWEDLGLAVEFTLNPRPYESLDMSWDFIVCKSHASIACTYNEALWNEQTIRHRLLELKSTLSSALASPNKPLKDLNVIPESESMSLGSMSRGPTVQPTSSHLSELLDLQGFADRMAAVCAGQSIDYSGLDRRSNKLANYLLEIGVKKNDLVGVFVERSINMLVSLLATWKAGAAYVSLDPSYPADRLLYMAQSAGLKALITEGDLDNALADYTCACIYLDGNADDISAQSAQAPTIQGQPKDTAYVIFTSGSTGKPKGVEITHGGVGNFLTAMAKRPGFQADGRLLAVTTLSFDIAVLELCLPLLVGGVVVIAEREEALDGYRLVELIEEHGVNVMQATPTTWRWMLAAGWKGGKHFKALCGGEPFPLDLARQLMSCVGEVWNMYGPTEATVWSTCHRLRQQDLESASIPVGIPIDNTQCYVLDDNLHPVPLGVPGELFIGGDGVANGYIGMPERTAERFIDNCVDGHGKLYRTGDQARWRVDGQLECLGRLDSQIKLRGYRIELGEIESVFSRHPDVIECAASIARFTDSDQRLVVYARSKPDSQLNSTEMRRYLRQFLPDYMVPQLFVAMDSFPLTPNGKVDRKNLPAPDPVGLSDEARAIVKPSTKTERELVRIWSELLKTEHEGVNELFFDVGGHSVLATEMIAKIEDCFGVRIHLLDILVSTIQQLAAKIDRDLQTKSVQAATIQVDKRPSHSSLRKRKAGIFEWFRSRESN